MDNVLLGITVALAILDWYAADRNLPIEKFTKPGVLIFLLAWFSSQGGWSGANLPFAMGLVFSLAGDTFLLWENRFCFLALCQVIPRDGSESRGAGGRLKRVTRRGFVRLLPDACPVKRG